jgi:nucleotide-binding universal stress UspA family protein
MARGTPGEEFPAHVAVGADGSEASGRAIQAGAAIAERCGSALQAVVATGAGATPDAAAARSALDAAAGPDTPLRMKSEAPVDALSQLDPDLLVVGSRGLQGLRSLGSVSERVAHEARCSVLVVR